MAISFSFIIDTSNIAPFCISNAFPCIDKTALTTPTPATMAITYADELLVIPSEKSMCNNRNLFGNVAARS